ncbi:hypothetical protein EMEDMD4_440168 [Sinorhizobium medicae]|uniref:Uncharacterized protein n=1 Tax=Sinorhizobium medicae TaxID=110321 RepID=A0A508WZB6_9HYPH|nr:hypothetical protein EMEDMD4_440168 [Sinorhizobium medicae]
MLRIGATAISIVEAALLPFERWRQLAALKDRALSLAAAVDRIVTRAAVRRLEGTVAIDENLFANEVVIVTQRVHRPDARQIMEGLRKLECRLSGETRMGRKAQHQGDDRARQGETEPGHIRTFSGYRRTERPPKDKVSRPANMRYRPAKLHTSDRASEQAGRGRCSI